MQLRIETLLRPEQVRTALTGGGWCVQQTQPGAWRVLHPEVLDEDHARQRLHEVGLLTSPLCRIEFQV